MNNVIIEVVITAHPGASCRKLIYNVGMVAEKLGLDMKITNVDSIKAEIGPQIAPPFILIGEFALGKNISPEKLEQILRSNPAKVSP